MSSRCSSWNFNLFLILAGTNLSVLVIFLGDLSELINKSGDVAHHGDTVFVLLAIGANDAERAALTADLNVGKKTTDGLKAGIAHFVADKKMNGFVSKSAVEKVGNALVFVEKN